MHRRECASTRLPGLRRRCGIWWGNKLGQPVWKLLGGRFREKVRIYADRHAGDALDSMSAVLQSRRPSWTGEASVAAGVEFKHHGWNPEEEEYPEPGNMGHWARRRRYRGFTALKFDADIHSDSDG